MTPRQARYHRRYIARLCVECERPMAGDWHSYCYDCRGDKASAVRRLRAQSSNHCGGVNKMGGSDGVASAC